MNENLSTRNRLLAEKVIKGLESRNMTGYYAETKEEALNDSGMLETLLGGVNIFADNNRFNLFRK